MPYYVRPLVTARWCVNRKMVDVTPDNIVAFDMLDDALNFCESNPPRAEALDPDLTEAYLADPEGFSAKIAAAEAAELERAKELVATADNARFGEIETAVSEAPEEPAPKRRRRKAN